MTVPIIYKSGDWVGDWLIIGPGKKRKGRGLSWEVRCRICGERETRRGGNLRRVLRHQCIGRAAKTCALADYKGGARLRGLPWELTDEYAIALMQGKCTYCNREPHMTVKPKKRESGPREWFIRNGIDRLDNEEGYTIKNCVPCCRSCNVMKGALPLEIWLRFLNRVRAHWKLGNYQEYLERIA